MSFYGGSFRSPETKEEVEQAARLLTGLGGIFVLMALMGVGLVWVYKDPKNLIITGVCGGVSLLLFAAGAYNRYYLRGMAHHPFVAAALRRPAITVCVILAVITALFLGFVALLIFLQ
jgi:hypothetical protein